MFPLKKLIINKKKSAIRNRMRGYRVLKESGQLDLLVRIKEDITNTPLTKINERSSSIYFGSGITNAEKVLRQFLILRFVSLAFNSTILIAIGKGKSKLNIPLPIEWRLVLEKYGFQADTFWNKIIWLSQVAFFYAYGILIGVQTFLNAFSIRKDFRNADNPSPTVYFNALSSNNLPQKKKGVKSYDIISWYSRWENRVRHLSAYCHSANNTSKTELNDVPVIYVSSALTSLKGFSQIFQFFLALFWMPLLCLLDLIRGRYWHALLLSESLRSFHFRLLNPEQISKHYLFHNTNYLFRPIWTYDAEERGARILFYFYSSNIERFKDSNGYNIQPYSWQIMTWSNYLVWDEYQADFIERMIGNGENIEIVGPIDFHDSNIEIQPLPKNSILVFDVQPHRDAQYQRHVFVPEYFVPYVVNQFLEDIYALSNKYSLPMVLKRKRHIGNLLNKKYSTLVDKLARSDNFISIDPDVAATRLIKEVEIVISFPFTATALIAKAEGKVSIFYDPIGIIQKDDRAAHGIDVITGRLELMEWMEKYRATQAKLGF